MSEHELPMPWAGVAVIEERKILTLKEKDKPFQLVPGGKVEPGETDKEAALREVTEELGVTALNLIDLATISTESKSTGRPLRFRVFKGELTQEPNPTNLPGKTESVAWLNSSYGAEGIEVGNLLSLLVPVLVKKGLID